MHEKHSEALAERYEHYATKRDEHYADHVEPTVNFKSRQKQAMRDRIERDRLRASLSADYADTDPRRAKDARALREVMLTDEIERFVARYGAVVP